MAKAGKVKCVCKDGPFAGETIWLSGNTLEFKLKKKRIYYNKAGEICDIITYFGYYELKEYWKSTQAIWVDKTEPVFQFELRENINGFSNGL